jgi:hypothetical protein
MQVLSQINNYYHCDDCLTLNLNKIKTRLEYLLETTQIMTLIIVITT